MAELKHGEWGNYDANKGIAQRFWNGEFLPYGQIEPGKYMDGYAPTSAPSIQTPSQSSEVQGYLDKYSGIIDQAQKTLQAPQKSNDEIFAEVKSQIVPATPLPEAPKLLDLYTKLTGEQGIKDLESTLSGLKEQEDLLATQLEVSNLDEEGKPVATNVIAGRQTEQQRQTQIQMDFLGRRKARVMDELSTRYSLINTIIQFTQTDYDNALKRYDVELSQNLTVYNAFTGELDRIREDRQFAAETVLKGTGQLIEWAREDAREARAQANANLTMYANLITSGNLSYDSMDANTKLQIQKLEVQSGLGVGFLSSIVSDNPNGKMIYAGANGAVFQNKDGTLRTVNYNVSGGSGGSGSISSADRNSTFIGALRKNANSYGHVSPSMWKEMIVDYIDAGGSREEFVKNFSQYADYNRGDFEKAYGFENPVKKNSKRG